MIVLVSFVDDVRVVSNKVRLWEQFVDRIYVL